MASQTTRSYSVWLSHLFSYCIAVHFFFGLISVLNTSNLRFFYSIPATVNIVIIGPAVDIFIWILSVVCLSIITILVSRFLDRRIAQTLIPLLAIGLSAALLMNLAVGFVHAMLVYLLFGVITLECVILFRGELPLLGQKPRSVLFRSLIYLLVFFAVIEISSATHYVISSLDRTTQIGHADAGVELQFSYAAYGVLPWLYLGFLFSWVWVPIVYRLLRFRGKNEMNVAKNGSHGNDSHLGSQNHAGLLSAVLDPRLLLALAVAIFIGYFVYFQNPPWLVGTDSYWRYYDPLLRMNAKGGFQGFAQALRERHPVPLMLLYSAQLISQANPFDVVKFAPLFLIVTLAFSMWWFLGRRRATTFGLIVFLTSTLSVVTTLGFYSSILANWMVLVVWVVFFAYLAFRADEQFRVRDFVVLLCLSTLMLLIHPWTWGVFAAAVFLAGILALVEERRRGLRVGGSIILILVLDALFAILSITFLAGSQGWRVVDALDLYTFVFAKPSTIFEFWAALNWLTTIWAPFFSPTYIVLAIIGVFVSMSPRVAPWRRRLILAWICVSAVGSVLVAPVGFVPGSPAQSDSQLWRLLFLTPFQVTAPLAIGWLSNIPYRYFATNGQIEGPRYGVWGSEVWPVVVFGIGILFAFVPNVMRPILLLIVLPVLTGFSIQATPNGENKFLSNIIMIVSILVAFNYAVWTLSQLLIDPHNYIPRNGLPVPISERMVGVSEQG